MREAQRTTRQRIADSLRDRPMDPAGIAREFDVDAGAALSHVEHIARSLESADEQLMVAPPECADCGFDGFEDLVNRPSRCPECKSENVGDPAYRIA